MTPDEHQRERMRHWSASFLASTALCAPHQNADMALAEFDKRFPAPVEPGGNLPIWTMTETEYLPLRQKARLWDAVATPHTIRLHQYADGPWFCTWMHGMETKTTGERDSAAEAVEAAIAAGALK